MATIIETCKDVLRTGPTYEKREEEFYLRNKRKAKLLANNLLQQEKLAKSVMPKTDKVCNAIKIMDNYSENYAEDMEKAIGMIGALVAPVISIAGAMALIKAEKIKNKKLQMAVKVLGLLAASSFMFVLAPFTAKKQIQASRAGRHMALKNELSDVRNFVIYTPEQIEKAQNIELEKPKNKPRDRAKNSYQNSFKVIKDFKKDYAEYKNDSKAREALDEEFERKLSKDYPAEELKSAYDDRELILNSTKLINNRAEEYSQNTENAYSTLNYVATILSFPLGFGLGAIVSLFVKRIPAILTKSLGGLATSLVTMSLLSVGTQRQKLASRVGRFVAEKELKANPATVMYFDDDKINAVNIENDYKKRGFWGKIWDNLTYIKKYRKDYDEYRQYRRTTGKEQRILNQKLKKVEITPEQLKNAEELQKKVLFVFNEIDEMSQSYSENMEAVNEIGMTSLSFLGSFLAMGASAFVALGFLKRKIKISKLFNKLTNIVFDKNSVIRKSVNEINDVAKTNKQARQNVDNIIYDTLFGVSKKSKPHDAEILKKIESPILNLRAKLNEILTSQKVNLREAFSAEIKQNKFAQYVYNLSLDILNEINRLNRKSAKMLGNDDKKVAQNAFETIIASLDRENPDKMGKTLKRTLIFGGVPILSAIFILPFILQSWFTNMQKKAGRIGVMKALDNVSDVRYYT